MSEEILRTEITPFEALKEEREEHISLEKPLDRNKLDLDEVETQKPNLDERQEISEGARQTEEEEIASEEPSDDEPGDPIVRESSEVPAEENDQYEVEDKSVIKYFAEALLQKGRLPEDFQITDDTTEADIDEAYLAFNTEPLVNSIREEELWCSTPTWWKRSSSRT